MRHPYPTKRELPSPLYDADWALFFGDAIRCLVKILSA